MRENKKNEYRSRVYTDRPDYADLPSPEKFQSIMGIIGTRLRQHPNAICSISGGSDSDIMIDLIERVRNLFGLPEIKYCFFNTGLEMEAQKGTSKSLKKSMVLRSPSTDRRKILYLLQESTDSRLYQK